MKLLSLLFSISLLVGTSATCFADPFGIASQLAAFSQASPTTTDKEIGFSINKMDTSVSPKVDFYNDES